MPQELQLLNIDRFYDKLKNFEKSLDFVLNTKNRLNLLE